MGRVGDNGRMTTASGLSDTIRQTLSSITGEIVATARAVHADSETAYQEHRSSARIAAVLSAHGFEVEKPAMGMETAFVGRQGARGPHVAFICEYDALPGIGHACGHNLIGTASLAAGIALEEAVRSAGVEARISVVGSPAEEGGGGKIPFCEKGFFDDVDAALIFHPSDRTQAEMYALACTHWQWRFRGRAAHAAGDPDQGINALDAFVHAYNGVSLWRQQLRDDARVHGFIAEGGTAPNIIPETTAGQFLTRSRDGAYLREMNLRFRAIFEAAAQATGCTLELDEEESYLDLHSNPVLADLCHAHLQAVGLEPKHAIPWDRVGSTDVGNVSYVCPTLHPEVAIVDEGVSCHTHEFREAADTDHAYDVLMRTSEALALTGAEVIGDAATRRLVRDAFAEQPWRRPQWRGSGA